MNKEVVMVMGRSIRRWVLAILLAASAIAGVAGGSGHIAASHATPHSLAGSGDPPYPPPH
jgi:ABC-type branched-subunit amino acid transport system permease subunit